MRVRALALTLVCARGSIELDPDPEAALGYWQEMLAWFQDHELVSELEPFEVALIGTAVGKLEESLLYPGLCTSLE